METLASAKAGVKRPLNLRESIYEMLRTRIQMGEITLDDKLVDHDIAKLMHVSRMPVREALLQLKSEGTLESTSRGFVLRRYTLREVEEVFEVRLLLEPHAAATASENADDAGLAKLKQALDGAESAQREADWAVFMRSSAAFRKAWLDLVPNRSLAETLGRYFDHVQVVRLMTMRDPEVRSAILDGLRASCEAFVLGDSALVRERIAAHTRATAVCCYESYRRQESDELSSHGRRFQQIAMP